MSVLQHFEFQLAAAPVSPYCTCISLLTLTVSIAFAVRTRHLL